MTIRASLARNAFARVIPLVLIFLFSTFHGPSVQGAQARTYNIAKKYAGLHEVKHNKKLRKVIGVNPRRTPWCGAFAGLVVKRAGKSLPNGHLRAANWKRAGKAVSLKKAKKGDVVVIRTRRGHHVGFYAGRKNGRVQLIGGNQSNMVKISNYSARSVVSVRRL